MQRSIAKYKIENFKNYIYYIHSDPLLKLVDIETEVIKSFPFGSYVLPYKKSKLYVRIVNNTLEAKIKNNIKIRLINPCLVKDGALTKISKPGELNPMFTKTHFIDTNLKISFY